MTGISEGTIVTLSKPVTSGFYYLGPLYGESNLPGVPVTMTIVESFDGEEHQKGDTTVVVEQLIPVGAHKWNKPGVTHAVYVAHCPHV